MVVGGTARAVIVASLLAGCSGAEEAARVELPVQVDTGSLVEVQTDLGYEVVLSEARLALENLEFAVAGEAHASWAGAVADFLVPPAWAHPGHDSGGDVTGELRGAFITSWLPAADAALGTATLLAGDYQSVNFTFRRAGPEDGLAASDGLLGHTATLRGSATRGGVRREFVAVIDAASGDRLVGVPFAVAVREGVELVIGLELVLRDPFEGDTLFDGIDFERLAPNARGELDLSAHAFDVASQQAQTLLSATFQAPDHFMMRELGTGAPRAD
jgi:hypothetical protein